ncbi:MAG: hypothetical protein QG658_37 [Patescibacteria group bacterium]|nr:hypothetical protein [Patescibacteria group bacterium]
MTEKYNWREYYEHHKNREPREELTQLLDVMRRERGSFEDMSALEIGAGNMIETKALLDAGFGHVTATDITDLAENMAASLQMDVNDFANDVERLEFLKVSHEELPDHLQAESLDLVVAYLSLQFVNPEGFQRLWQSLVQAVKPGGRITLDLIGDHDGWAKETLADESVRYKDMNFHSREEVERLLAGFEQVQVIEDDSDGKTSDGVAKHWHIFHIQAQKPTDA